MENRLKVQDIQGDELYMELTPEELKELEQLKGGGLPFYSEYSIYKPFPLGTPNPYFKGIDKLVLGELRF